MPTKLKRVTFAITPDIEKLMDEAKQMFYNHTQSDIIRILVLEGLNALKKEKIEMKQEDIF